MTLGLFSSEQKLCWFHIKALASIFYCKAIYLLDDIWFKYSLLLCSSTVRDKIIPHAVSWFTGEAIEGEEFEIDNDDEDDIDEDEDEDEEDDEDEEEDDDDEDEEEEEISKTKKKVFEFLRFYFFLSWKFQYYCLFY